MARDKSMPQSLPRIYGGTLIDGWCLGQVTRGGADIGQSVFLCLLDMPLSLVGDTCLLPFTIYLQIKFGNLHPRPAAVPPATRQATCTMRPSSRHFTSIAPSQTFR
jgi:uncharacterized protein YceK